MPEFMNPFSGRVPERKLTRDELIRAIRLDIAAEHEATHLYMAHAEAIDDPLARAVLIDIANEERVHIGEFQRLLQMLTGDEDQWVAEGVAEVDEIAAAVAAGAWTASVESDDGDVAPGGSAAPVGGPTAGVESDEGGADSGETGGESRETGGVDAAPASPPSLGSLRP